MGVFGAIGSGGLAVALVLYMFLGTKGKGRINLDSKHLPYWAFAFGEVCSTAGQAFSAPKQLGTTLSTALTANSGQLGTVGVGAVAVIMVLIVFGTGPKPLMDTVLSSTAPSVFAAAGGLWLIPGNIIGTLLHVFGAGA